MIYTIEAKRVVHQPPLRQYLTGVVPRKALLIMKLVLFLILCFTLSAVADATAQKVDLSVRNASFKSVIRLLQKQSGYTFVADEAIIRQAKPVSVTASNVDILDLLPKVFENQPFGYKVERKSVYIVEMKAEDLKEPAQQRTVHGKVTDSLGNPLRGVTVLAAGTTNRTMTDGNGLYELNDVPEGATLLFRLLSYETLEVPVDRPVINVVLKFVHSFLDETMVIGYGVTSRRLATGSVAKVSGETIAQQPVTNPLQALSGRIPGLVITQSSGLPDADIDVQIRGRNSIAASNVPLYIIDGVPFGNLGNATSLIRNPLNSISPFNIESIEVLKDADATAIYGSRGANGVILITTKASKDGNQKFDFSINKGIGRVTRMAKTLNTEEYLALRKHAFDINDVTPTVANARDILEWDEHLYTDWQDYMFGGKAEYNEVSTSFGGGNQNINFLVGGQYHFETTVYPTDDNFKRGGVHLGVNYLSNNQKLKVNTKVFYNLNNNLTYGTSGQVLNAAILPPNYPVRDENGDFYWISGITNPIAGLGAMNSSKTSNLNGNINVEYSIFDGLAFRTSLGYNAIDISRITTTPRTAQNPLFNLPGNSLFGDEFISTLIVEPQFNFRKDLGIFSVDALIGGTYQSNHGASDNIYGSNYTDDTKLEVLRAAGSINVLSSINYQYKYASLFSRIILNRSDKYILNLNVRRDGSSRFGLNNRFGNFGAVGAAWIFSNERMFARTNSSLSFGKIRVSYGTTGNDGIGDYGFLSTYQITRQYGTDNAIVPARLANPDFQWEVNRKFETALDIGFFKDRILFNAAYFLNRSSNQLVGYPLPTITGFSSYQANLPATVQNSGVEFSLNTANIVKQNVNWKSDFNLTIARNKLIDYPDLAGSSYASSYVVGQPLSIVQLYQFSGFDMETGFPMVKDVNNDGQISNSSSYNDSNGDRVIAGYTYPKFYGGVNNSISIKNWEIDLFFQFVKQDGYNLNYQISRYGRLWNNWSSYLDSELTPAPASGGLSTANGRYAQSDASFSDASFIRLKNLAISYRLPEKATSKIKINSAQIFLQGQNLITFTRFNGYDPESSFSTTLNVPSLRMTTIGVRFSL